jgi:hypothetical protein
LEALLLYTSKKINKGFEVNKRLVYGMRLIGQGRASAKTFLWDNEYAFST